MGEQTKISWCDSTFNPWIGCTKLSDGCKHCYALDLMETRYQRVKWGPQGTRQRTGASNWRKPLQWNKQEWEECIECGWRGSRHETHDFCPNCDGEELRPTRQRVFCASLADVFEDNPQLTEWRVDLFRMIVHTPNLDWLLLTKRPENANQMLLDMGWANWMDNIWIGTSVENQEQAEKRIPHLLNVEAPVKFLSCEPLLGPLNLEDLAYEAAGPAWAGYNKLVDWIIVGGESGQKARSLQLEWARSLRDQCQAAGTAFFMKQLGGISDKRHDLTDFPEDLRIREFPQ